jgi:hypothetical protein
MNGLHVYSKVEQCKLNGIGACPNPSQDYFNVQQSSAPHGTESSSRFIRTTTTEQINFAIIPSVDEISGARTRYYYMRVLHANLLWIWTCTHANGDLK